MRQLSALCLFALVGVSLCWRLRGRASGTCEYNGETLMDGESVGEGCDLCTCLDGGIACVKKRSCTTTHTETFPNEEPNEVPPVTCSYGGNEYSAGDIVYEGDHHCRCTDSGFMLCSRSLRRRTSNDHCVKPDGSILQVGQREIIDEGEDTCARCECRLNSNNKPSYGCVSCAPPVQPPQQGGHIEPGNRRQLRRRISDDSCETPWDTIIPVGGSEIVDEGKETCARCSCHLDRENKPSFGCVSCAPPVQPPPQGGHIEPGNRRQLGRRTSEDSCQTPWGSTLPVGQREIIDEGEETCARCECHMYKGKPSFGCVSCAPPVQPPPQGGHIEPPRN